MEIRVCKKDSSSSCIILLGSNGAVGEVFYQSIIKSNYSNYFINGADRFFSGHSNYVKAVDYILSQLPQSLDVQIIFCAGKGGFSLTSDSASIQKLTFKSFCSSVLGRFKGRIIYVSSLGAACSVIPSSYKDLVIYNEALIANLFPDNSLILRLPSLYGLKQETNKYYGLIGAILESLKKGSYTTVYSSMFTRRFYLSCDQIGSQYLPALFHGCGGSELGILNIMPHVSLSVFDVCQVFYKAIGRYPSLKIAETGFLPNKESHFSTSLPGRIIRMTDSLPYWILRQW